MELPLRQSVSPGRIILRLASPADLIARDAVLTEQQANRLSEDTSALSAIYQVIQPLVMRMRPCQGVSEPEAAFPT